MKRFFTKILMGLLGLILVSVVLPQLPAQAAETVSDDQFLYTITDGVATIGSCLNNDTTDLVVPETINGYPVVGYGDNVCYECHHVTVTLPDNMRIIGKHAFDYCINLKSIDFGNGVTTIEEAAFYYCTAIETITLPDSVTRLDKEAFYHCTVKQMNFGAGVATLGEKVFGDCANLIRIDVDEDNPNFSNDGSGILYNKDKTKIVHVPRKVKGLVTIPASLESMSEGTFYANMTVTGYQVEEGSPYFAADDRGVLFNKDMTRLIVAPANLSGSYTAPSTVQSIDSYAFRRCIYLTEAIFNSPLSDVGDYAFQRCTELKRVVLGVEGDGTGVVPRYTFDGCTALETLTIGNGFRTVAAYTYVGLSALKELNLGKNVGTANGLADVSDLLPIATLEAINVSGDNPALGSVDGILYNKDKTVLYRCPMAKSGDIVLPDSVTTIGDSAFKNCKGKSNVTLNEGLETIQNSAFYSHSGLLTITFPESLTTIGKTAFCYCSSLQRVEMGDNVTSIGNNLFQNSNALEYVRLSGGLTEIPQYTFSGCMGLKTVILPDGLKEIGNRSFQNCSALESITLPEGLETIGWNAFMYTIALKTISLPDSLTSLGSEAFGHSGLQQVKLSKGLTAIPTDAFSYCKSLTSIEIPAGVTDIGAYAFYYCTALKEIRFTGNAPTFGTYALRGVTATAYYPATATGWSSAISSSYGGTITWEAMRDSQNLTLKYPTLSFEDEILMNIYYTVDNMEGVEEMGLLTYSQKPATADVETAEAVIPGYVMQGTYYCVTTEGIAPKRLGDPVYFAIYAKRSDGKYSYSPVADYSPKNYAYSLLQSSNVQMRQLAAAVLEYGAAAQTYFNHNTDAMINADLTAEQKAFIEAYRSDMMDAVKEPTADKQGIFTDSGRITTRYRTVSFEGAFSVNYYCNFLTAPVGDVIMYYWTGADYEAAESLTVENATAALTMKDMGGGQYMATVEDIAARNLDKGFYVAFVYSDGTAQYHTDLQTYSIGAYCNSTVNKNIAASPLAAATAVYGYYAKQMFG